MSGTIRKINLIDDAIRTRYDMALEKWVRLRLGEGKSWRAIADELERAVGWGQKPITHSGLHRWWMNR